MLSNGQVEVPSVDLGNEWHKEQDRSQRQARVPVRNVAAATEKERGGLWSRVARWLDNTATDSSTSRDRDPDDDSTACSSPLVRTEDGWWDARPSKPALQPPQQEQQPPPPPPKPRQPLKIETTTTKPYEGPRLQRVLATKTHGKAAAPRVSSWRVERLLDASERADDDALLSPARAAPCGAPPASLPRTAQPTWNSRVFLPAYVERMVQHRPPAHSAWQ